MNILLVVEGIQKEDTTFSLLSLKEKTLLLQFSPEFHLQGLSLAELYATSGIDGIKQNFLYGCHYWIDGYVVIPVKNAVSLLRSFFPEGINYCEETENRQLSDEEICQLLSYTEELDENFLVFSRQKYFFEQLSQRLAKKRNLLRIFSIIKLVNAYVKTDIEPSKWHKLVLRYVNGLSLKQMTEVTFPLQETFRMIRDGVTCRVKMIDITKNEQYLRTLLLQEQLKES